MSKFKEQFKKEITKKLTERLNVKNPMGVPRLVKIVVNESTKDFLADKKNLEKAAEDLVLITGQKPKVARARVSVATFKLRKGDEIGLVVTLRGARMYDFFEKIVKIVLPRVRDFSGIAPNAFDGRGNLSIGFTENTVFPEIDSGKVDRVRSLQVTIITNAGDNERARVLLEEMGMRFKK
ncbi:MAG: 50S ribosomal protein L5 [Candidatus Levybacteria bacterium RIFCSPHIGHO2_02_FULL_40_18]|nr:MAG: 50S ribosomal protein L5 [Candidatus Levybacteria bacterium RIFCSPHIGHO2_01_FULL_40_58]OGH26396.1 MAG: 50S ribosomal protein L5 [Candidatus Levybacteria bacterium RIFCSPHIGHO2_02_FULL_40_18]OGH31843.1 MAG: 50S ribosomal protein L5 [Candidatus Levybacteria bacterium RIFCSPHIGHO2_12_FULL_40_31]OGH40476.1 MAG: 50S ribosomal protein L5 [Candidatus Levybacteria bacterium RIFCSPLOWO2_01_FULL_40_64]OGH49185.1 MAG: 50S ribosomal protein L5 [Candidatus Levybacteria bacterium RIFCSPLOWO2_02_FULL_